MLAKLLIACGLGLLLLGLALQFAPGLLTWFGRLPGELSIERDGSRVFIPIRSMIIVSIVLRVIVNLSLRR
jgi:hypothetical protein